MRIRSDFFPLSRPSIGEEEIGAVSDYLRSGRRILSLPLFPGMADAGVESVCEAVHEILSEAVR